MIEYAILGVAVLFVAAALGLCVYFIKLQARAQERQQKHLEEVLEAFLSRDIEQKKVSQMIRDEVHVEQIGDTDQDPDTSEAEKAAWDAFKIAHPNLTDAELAVVLGTNGGSASVPEATE